MANPATPSANHNEHHRLKGERSDRLLVELMRDSPLRDLAIEPAAVRAPVRSVNL